MMKKLLLSTMLMLAWIGAARATQETIGNGTVSLYELPFNMKHKYSLTQQLYLAEELGGSGYINSISFHYAYSSPFTMTGIQVYLNEVDESTTYSKVFPISSSDKVFEGTISASGAGWVTINLDTPFEYSGTKNLLVSCYNPTGGNSYSDSFKFYCTGTDVYKCVWYESDDQYINLNKLSSYPRSFMMFRSNTKFDISHGPITKSLTVCDGTETNNYVPVYGYYTDWYQKSEFIIPANKLLQLEDNTISKMTFYLSSPASGSWRSAKFKVFLKEVDATTISSYYGTSGATTVYEGPLDATKSTMDIEFTTPYHYHGGNLLVGVYQTTKGTDNSATFFGSTASNASIHGISSLNLDDVSINYENFIPKTTFAYYYKTSLTCPKPQDLTVKDIDTWNATLSWTSDAAQWDLRYKSKYDSNWQHVEGLTSPTYTFNELMPATRYEVQVRSNCGGGAVSYWVSTSFVTKICDEKNLAAISYELIDSYGDGWNGNAIKIVHSNTGLVVATLDMVSDDGKMKTGTIDLCLGEDYDFVWEKGSYSGECGFTIKDNFGEDIIACQKCDALQPGLITTYGISWNQSSGKRPTNLAIAEGPGPDRVTLTWTPGSENQTTWDFSYSKEGDMVEYGVENVQTTSPRYEFTGLDRYPLEPNTTYRVKMRSSASNEGGMSDWSNIVTFTTSGENPIPSQVNVETTYNQATISWVGYSYCYDVKCRVKGDTYWRYVYRTGFYGNTQNTYVLTGLDPDTEYEYQIVGIAYPNVANVGTAYATFKTKGFTAPQNLTVSEITSSSAKVMWDKDAYKWEVRFKAADDETWTDVGITSEPSYMISEGLQPATTYQVRVRTVFAENHLSDWVEITFTTEAPEPSNYLVNVPEDATIEEDWVIDGEIQYYSGNSLFEKTTKVAFAGNEVYIQGLAYYFPDAWIKGTISGSTATFPSGQFVGEDEYGFEYMVGYDGTQIVDNIMFSFDSSAKKFTMTTPYLLENSEINSYLPWAVFQDLSVYQGEVFVPEVVDAPEGLTTQKYIWTCNVLINGEETDYSHTGFVNIGFNGNDVYVQGMCEDLPDAWIKGTKNGNNVTFRTGQYFGEITNILGYIYPYYFVGYTGTATSDVVFTYNTTTKTFTADTPFLLNEHRSIIRPYITFNNNKWELLKEKVAVPACPSFTMLKLEGTSYPYVDLDIPFKDVDGNEMNPDKLYYRLYSDVEHVKDLIVFVAGTGDNQYKYFTETLTEIPYLFNDDYDIYKCGKRVYLNQGLDFLNTLNRIGVQSVYYGGLAEGQPGKTSPIVWCDIKEFTTPEISIATGVEAMDNGQWTIDDSTDKWYTIDGQKLSGKPTKKGVYIYNGKRVVIR